MNNKNKITLKDTRDSKLRIRQFQKCIFLPAVINSVVSIELSPLSSVELTTSWYQVHNGDYKGILGFVFI